MIDKLKELVARTKDFIGWEAKIDDNHEIFAPELADYVLLTFNYVDYMVKIGEWVNVSGVDGEGYVLLITESATNIEDVFTLKICGRYYSIELDSNHFVMSNNVSITKVIMTVDK